MELTLLPSLGKLCPNITILELTCSNEDLNHLESLKNFRELTSLHLFGSGVNLSLFNNFFKLPKENKLKKIIFPKFHIQNPETVLEFYKILFETNLEEFEGIHLKIDHTEIESKLISSWIEKNSNLKKISLNCVKNFKFNRQ
jgi:hypothetical protein